MGVVRRIFRMVGMEGVSTDVIAPPPGDLFSETNDNSVAILLTYGMVRVCSPATQRRSEVHRERSLH